MAATTDTFSPELQDQIAPPPPRGMDFDVFLVLVVAALLSFGLLMVYSTTFDWSYLEFGSPLRIFLNQVRSAIIGLVMMALMWRMDYRRLKNRNVASAIMLVTIAGLGGLLLLNNQRGTGEFGVQRSLYQGSFQPGEVAKLAVIIYFAAWLASRREQLHKIGYGLIPFSILVGAVGGLIVLQPDLSTAAIIVLTAATMFFIAGANLVQIALITVGAVGLGWLLATQFDYARLRLINHINALNDLTKASWHVQQAVIAFRASGSREGNFDSFSPNWFGVGLGQSSQKFGFLPAAHTDSIFAIIGEELGVFGCLFVILLFVLFVWRAFHIAAESKEPFGQMLAAGIASWIALEAMFNVAVMTTIVPFSGVVLPFISYGGSSLVVVLTAVGLLLSISRRRPLLIENRAAPRAILDAGPSDPRARRRVSRVGRTRYI